VGGQPTGELALRVVVEKKKPIPDLASEEIIPSEISGVKTDVVEGGPAQYLQASTASSEPPAVDGEELKYRPLMGGIRIQIETGFLTAASQQIAGFEPSAPPPGTLGCIALTKEAPPKVVGLTNHHVLLELDKPGDRVGQPRGCSTCSLCLTDAVGTILRGTSFKTNPRVDAAIFTLNAGLTYRREVVKEVTGGTVVPLTVVTGTRSLGEDDLRQRTRVQKRGFWTGLTTGIISGLHCKSPGTNKIPPTEEQIEITPDPPDSLFVNEGDSGSVILVENTGIVVALLWGKDFPTAEQKQAGVKSFVGIASPIEAVLNELQIDLAIGDNPGHVYTVPPAAGMEPAGVLPVASGASAPAAGGAITIQQPLLLQAQEELLRTPGGKHYAGLVRQHQLEVRMLINTNKRVAAVWHRNGGPGILQRLFQTVQSPDAALPTSINGQPLTDSLEKIFGAFKSYGSPDLATDIERYGPTLLEFIGMSYAQILNRLRAASG